MLFRKAISKYSVDRSLYEFYQAAAETEKVDPMYSTCLGEDGNITYDVKDEYQDLDRQFTEMSDKALFMLKKAKKKPSLYMTDAGQKALEKACNDYADFDLDVKWIGYEKKRYLVYTTRENILKHCKIRYISRHLPLQRMFGLTIVWDAEPPFGVNQPGVQKMFSDFECFLLINNLVNPSIIDFFNRVFTSKFLVGKVEPMPKKGMLFEQLFRPIEDKYSIQTKNNE
jgi:hypothetical protein